MLTAGITNTSEVSPAAQLDGVNLVSQTALHAKPPSNAQSAPGSSSNSPTQASTLVTIDNSMGACQLTNNTANASTWSSLEGMPRTAWQVNPRDTILQSSGFAGRSSSLDLRDPSPSLSQQSSNLSHSFDGNTTASGIQRSATMPPQNTFAGTGMPARAPSLPAATSVGGNATLSQQALFQQFNKTINYQGNGMTNPQMANLQAVHQLPLHNGLGAQSNGIQNSQQALLLQHMLLQQQQQQQQQQQYSRNQPYVQTLNNNAAIQQLLAQQNLVRNGSMGFGSNGNANPALAAALMQNQQLQQGQLAAAQQQLLLQQAMRSGALGGVASGRPGQLQSEALIAMQRQQNLRGPIQVQPQLDQQMLLAQLGLNGRSLNGNGLSSQQQLNAQQQIALLNALQGNSIQRGAHPMAQQAPGRQSGYGIPLQGGNAQVPNVSLLAAALSAQQHSRGGGNVPAPHMNTHMPPTPNGFPTQQAAAPQSDPVQTLQDIGRTLAQLNITVEAAVNAGLLGGLSASDVKIVAEAHRVEADRIRPGASNGSLESHRLLPIHQRSQSVGHGSPPGPPSPTGSHCSAPPAIGDVHAMSAFAGPQSAPALSCRASSVGDDEFPVDLDDEPAVKKNHSSNKTALELQSGSLVHQGDAGQYGFFNRGGGAGGGADALGKLGEACPTVESLTGGIQNGLSLSGNPPPPSQHVPQNVDTIASLWGDGARGDARDPFGSYLAGLRLGTGF